MKHRVVILILAFVMIAIISGLVAHYLVGLAITPGAVFQPAAAPASPAPTTGSVGGRSIVDEIFGGGGGPAQPNEPWAVVLFRILLRLAVAAALATLLAYRPRRDVPLLLRNPFVAQTQILLAVVASALMMIVGDNAARAFGIFAAASLVRFRTNISDPKEITVILIGLAIGLATGVGHLELALILALFMFVVLFVLEHFEPAQISRAMELGVITKNVDATQSALKRIFDRHKLDAEVREVKREDEADPTGRIVYQINVPGSLSTDKLSSEVFSAGGDDIDGVEWQHTKSNSYIYR